MSKKQGVQCYRWCFTFNNYEMADILNLRILFNKITKKYVFQEEMGECGTKHLQGSISLKVKARLTEMKKINPKIHWEPTKNADAADAYACKAETRCGEVYTHEKRKPFQRTVSKFDEIVPREEVIKLIEEEPDKRTIHWVWSAEGKLGKTSTAAYIEHNYEGVCVANGKAADIKNQIVKVCEEDDLNVLIITIPRSARDYLGGLYGVLEEVKDGLIYSGKYEGGFLNIEHPHVIVMCNFPPDETQMSEDRWNVIELLS